jgi:hypothetical protein
MIAFALFSVLASGLVSVPPAKWTAVDVNVPSNGAIVDCTFKVVNGERVQVLLLDRQQARRFHRGRAVQPLYSSGFTDGARFLERIDDAGEYVLLVDNRLDARSAAQVQLRLELLQPHAMNVRTAPPERRRAVVALSLLFFGAVLAFSAGVYLKNT